MSGERGPVTDPAGVALDSAVVNETRYYGSSHCGDGRAVARGSWRTL